LKRAWEHDYFTSCLPTTQLGTEVSLPLSVQNDIPVEFFKTDEPGKIRQADGSLMGGPADLQSGALPDSNLTAGGAGAVYDPAGTLVVDVNAGAASINDFREAWSFQVFLERSIRGGARYFEQLFSIWGQKSPDSRLQRPEYIGRDVQTMTIGEVLATAQSNNDGETAEINVGTMAGHGVSVGGRDGITYKCEEHGFIIGLMSIIPDTAYQNGLHKMFSKVDRLDYAVPDLAHIGEQPVLYREIMANLSSSAPVDPTDTFGYLPQYSDYRYFPSQVAGDFRDTLAYWTLGRIFDNPAAPPQLTEEFIECNPRLDIFAVPNPDIDHVVVQVINKITVDRKLPRFSVPSSL